MALNIDMNTRNGRKAYAMHIRSMCVASSGSKKRDIECWNMYNEFQDEKEFDYLRKIGDYELPAKIRNVGKQRSKINHLVSQQSRRPYEFSVHAIDRNSLAKKYDDICKSMLDRIEERVKERYYSVTLKIQNIEQQMEQLQQMMQQAQEQNADPATISQLQSVIPQYLLQLQSIKASAERQQLFSKNELEEINRYYRYNYKDIREELSEKLSKSHIDRLEIKEKAIRNFISQCVTGKQYYYVNYTPGNKLPDFENINALKVYFPSIDGVKWTHKGPWVAIEENKSYLDVRKQYKHLGALTEEEWAEIDEASNRAENSAIVVTPDHGAIFSDGVYAGTLENNSANIVKELRIWWKVERKIPIKKSPNNYNGKTFTHFITSGKSILTSDDYYFKNGKYVNKETKEQIPSSEVEFINKEKGEYVYERAILDRYYAVILNDKYFIDFGKDKIQPRSVDDYYDVMLPVVGKTYSTITDRPYSLIWSTKDLQKLYKIIHYHRELLLAISGTRGNVIDLSQKPPDMSRKEWEYHKKLGRLYIKTTDEHGRKINNSFNQWAAFDDTVTTSITYLDGMLDSIDNEISDTMGMPRQRMGVTVSTDQVGSNQMALNQSLLTTEILYYDQDLILSKAQSMFLNLCVKYCYTEDELFEIMSSDLAKDIVKIPAGMLKNSDWEIVVRDNSKNEQRLNELKQLAIRQNDKGQLPFNQFLEVWNEDSLTSLIKKFEYFSEKAIEIQQMAASQEKQDMIDIEKAKIDYQNQYDMFMEQEKNKLEQAKIQLEGMKIQNEKQRDLMKARNDELKLQQERQLRAAEIESENAVELAYLENQDRHETNNEQLQALQLKLDAMFNELGLRLQQHDRVTTHIETMRKLDIEDKKAKSKVKISDR